MDNEKINGQSDDWFENLTPGGDPDTDQEAEAWLEELLATVNDLADTPAEENAPAPDPAPQPEEEDILFDQLLSPMADAQEIGTDEQAISDHQLTDLADMELDKIMQEAMSDDWDISAIEHEILSEPIPEVFPETSDPDFDADSYTDNGEQPLEEDTERKVRPKKKNVYGLFGLPHLLSTAIWAALCITIGITLGRWVWICVADVLGFGFPNQEVSITVTADDTIDTVTDKLLDAGLIKYSSIFKAFCQLTDAQMGVDITVGSFTLNKQDDYHALLDKMSAKSQVREIITVVIPEGYTCAQIFALLEEHGVCTVQAMEEYCCTSQFSSYWFLENIEKGTKYCLEGYLFPDTYEFYVGSTPKQVLIKLLANFDNHITEAMMAQLDTLNETLAAKYKKNGMSQSYIDEHLLTINDVITVASMIEKETAYSGESQNIASVIYNRLTNPTNYPKLNIDATIVYALGGKTDLTNEDMEFDSPYNTYLYEGLPPGAISNPGLYSIQAALNPNSTSYYFYALDTSGEVRMHKFFKTYQEHQNFLNSQG